MGTIFTKYFSRVIFLVFYTACVTVWNQNFYSIWMLREMKKAMFLKTQVLLNLISDKIWVAKNYQELQKKLTSIWKRETKTCWFALWSKLLFHEKYYLYRGLLTSKVSVYPDILVSRILSKDGIHIRHSTILIRFGNTTHQLLDALWKYVSIKNNLHFIHLYYVMDEFSEAFDDRIKIFVKSSHLFQHWKIHPMGWIFQCWA